MDEIAKRVKIYMKGWQVRTPVILVLLILFLGVATVTVANAAKSEIVSEVYGLRDYVLDDNSFTHGSTLKVYTEMRDVNYEGFVFVEFVYILEDPKGNVVSMDRMDVSRRDYNEHVYVVYSKNIPSWWLYGRYKLEIYAYNSVNKDKIREFEQRAETSTPEELIEGGYFDDMKDFFETGEGDLSVSLSDSEKEVTRINFFVVKREEEITTAGPSEVAGTSELPFTITDIKIDKFTVKPDEPVTIAVTVENRGAMGTETVSLVINDEVVAEESVTLDHLASITLYFTSEKNLPGTYKVSILGTDIVKVFFVEEPSEVEEGDEGGDSTAFAAPVAQQPGEGEGGDGRSPSNPVFALCITLVVILALVIILLHINSKRHNRIF